MNGLRLIPLTLFFFTMVGAGGPAGAASSGVMSPVEAQPPLLDSRPYIDSYSFWALGDDGAFVYASILLSNLAGQPTRPAITVEYFGAGGQKIRMESEFEGDDLKVSGPPLSLQFGKNTLSTDGKGYHLHLEGPDATGAFTALDLTFTPAAPSHQWGAPLAIEDGRFWMGHLFPTSSVTGSLTSAPGVIAISGQAYGDHTWQDAWAHHIARRWVNLRFYSDGPDLALTTWVSPKGEGHALGSLVEGGKLLHSITAASVAVTEGPKDKASGYPQPKALTVDVGPAGRLELNLGSPLEQRDLLEGLSPVVKTVIKWIAASPYSYRYKVPATLALPGEAGQAPRQVSGVVVAEVLYVNAP